MSDDGRGLTAEDWKAARRSLGRGSRSLLTGTSTRALDSIVQDYAATARNSPEALCER